MLPTLTRQGSSFVLFHFIVMSLSCSLPMPFSLLDTHSGIFNKLTSYSLSYVFLDVGVAGKTCGAVYAHLNLHKCN